MANPGTERGLVRILTAVALCAALLTCAQVPVPDDSKGNLALPAISFEQVGLYRLEVAVLVFYGALLLVTPAFSGLIRGRLPIEISVRGAKFGEEADRSAELTKEGIEKLELVTTRLADGIKRADLEIDRLKEQAGDSTQPRVNSNR